ncbi:MAG: SpoIIE family protein phosphatase [Caulobacteraceae bacterium]|nr:SpoIIE family protein phosphatase [Caulobacteraceae bacterium]
MVDWAVCGEPFRGERESGDLHVAADYPGGMLLGVIDGLGHGPEAAAAARAAAAALTALAGQPVLTLIRACHEALRSTRGAVMSLAAIDTRHGAMTWAGVGNVEAVLHRADPARAPGRERILLRSGVVGYQLPPLRATELPLFRGDMLVMVTDGLKHDFCEEPPLPGPAAAQAELLLRTYSKGTDDALVLTARYAGVDGSAAP